MKIFKKEPDFKLMNKRFYAFILSVTIIALGVFVFFTKGFNLGVDFKGGAKIMASFKDFRTEDDLRTILKNKGFAKYTIQKIKEPGNKFFIETPTTLKESSDEKDPEDEASKIKNISSLSKNRGSRG